MGPVRTGILLLPVLVFGSCDPAREEPDLGRANGQEESLRITDDAGRVHRLYGPPRRIVSLVPSATEILLGLGEADRLVARTDFDTASALQPLPSVGGGLEPNIERLLSLAPDLVIRFHAPSDPFTPERLDRAGIPHFAVRPDRIEDIRRVALSLGRLVGRTERAEEEIRRMEGELAEIRAAVEGRPRPKVAYLLGGNPPWVAGGETFVDELLTIAGADNAFRDLRLSYAEVSLEALSARDVERILLVENEPLPSGVPAGLIERVSPLTRSPGIRLPEAARELARILHPTAFR